MPKPKRTLGVGLRSGHPFMMRFAEQTEAHARNRDTGIITHAALNHSDP